MSFSTILTDLKTTQRSTIEASDGVIHIAPHAASIEFKTEQVTEADVQQAKKLLTCLVDELGFSSCTVKCTGSLAARAWSAGLMPRAQSTGRARSRSSKSSTVRFRCRRDPLHDLARTMP